MTSNRRNSTLTVIGLFVIIVGIVGFIIWNLYAKISEMLIMRICVGDTEVYSWREGCIARECEGSPWKGFPIIVYAETNDDEILYGSTNSKGELVFRSRYSNRWYTLERDIAKDVLQACNENIQKRYHDLEMHAPNEAGKMRKH